MCLDNFVGFVFECKSHVSVLSNKYPEMEKRFEKVEYSKAVKYVIDWMKDNLDNKLVYME